MDETAPRLARLFSPDFDPGRSVLWPRWIFLRCLGLIFFSAFYSLAFQIRGLIGPRGLLPAGPTSSRSPSRSRGSPASGGCRRCSGSMRATGR